MDYESIPFLSPTLNINIISQDADQSTYLRDTHFHNAAELIRVEAGDLICIIDGISMPIQSGEILLIGSRVVHRLICPTQAKFTYFQIDMELYLSSLKAFQTDSLHRFLFWQNAQTHCVFPAKGELGALLYDIQSELSRQDFCYTSYIISDIYRIGAIMQRNKLLPNPELLSKEKTVERLLPAIRYAEAHFAKKLTLDEIAALLHMDKFYFCKLFRKTFGATFVDYLNFLRLQKAQSLLAGSDMTLSEIAFASGFHSLQYFNRLFLRECGCSPKTYRSTAQFIIHNA